MTLFNTKTYIKKGLWYANMTYGYRGLWLTYSGDLGTPTIKQVQDDFGNLVSV